MSTQRWLAFAAALVVLFVASMAAGALVARMGSTSGQPVADANPTPAVTASPATLPTPVSTLVPTSQPSLAPPTASPAPTAAPTDTAPPDTLSAEGFAQELASALRDGDAEYLFEHLHPATIERYGEQACRGQVAPLQGDPGWEILGSSGPAPWSYETDGIATTIDDAWTVSVRQPGADPELREFHVARADGAWRWFTDCGNPR